MAIVSQREFLHMDPVKRAEISFFLKSCEYNLHLYLIAFVSNHEKIDDTYDEFNVNISYITSNSLLVLIRDSSLALSLSIYNVLFITNIIHIDNFHMASSNIICLTFKSILLYVLFLSDNFSFLTYANRM